MLQMLGQSKLAENKLQTDQMSLIAGVKPHLTLSQWHHLQQAQNEQEEATIFKTSSPSRSAASATTQHTFISSLFIIRLYI